MLEPNLPATQSMPFLPLVMRMAKSFKYRTSTSMRKTYRAIVSFYEETDYRPLMPLVVNESLGTIDSILASICCYTSISHKTSPYTSALDLVYP